MIIKLAEMSIRNPHPPRYYTNYMVLSCMPHLKSIPLKITAPSCVLGFGKVLTLIGLVIRAYHQVNHIRLNKPTTPPHPKEEK